MLGGSGDKDPHVCVSVCECVVCTNIMRLGVVRMQRSKNTDDERMSERKTERKTLRKTERKTERTTERQTDKKADKKTDKKTDKRDTRMKHKKKNESFQAKIPDSEAK